MKFIVSREFHENHTFDAAQEAAQYIAENMYEDVYDDMLDECYEEIDILGIKYSPSVVLLRVDPVAYRCGMNDYFDSLQSDMVYDMERMDDGEEIDFYGFTVTAEEDEKE